MTEAADDIVRNVAWYNWTSDQARIVREYIRTEFPILSIHSDVPFRMMNSMRLHEIYQTRLRDVKLLREKLSMIWIRSDLISMTQSDEDAFILDQTTFEYAFQCVLLRHHLGIFESNVDDGTVDVILRCFRDLPERQSVKRIGETYPVVRVWFDTAMRLTIEMLGDHNSATAE